MTLEGQYRAHDILRRLLAWNGDRWDLDTLQGEIVALCGPGAILDLPENAEMLREKLIDVLEDYLESGG